jgi:hypothetical protein
MGYACTGARIYSFNLCKADGDILWDDHDMPRMKNEETGSLLQCLDWLACMELVKLNLRKGKESPEGMKNDI